MISPGSFVESVPVYHAPKLSMHRTRHVQAVLDTDATNSNPISQRPTSASMSYISRNRHIKSAKMRPVSASTQLSSFSHDKEIHIERRMIWNEEIIGMVIDELRGGTVLKVRIYMRNNELLADLPVENWPRSHLKPVARSQFVARTKIPFIQQKWIPKEVRNIFMLSKRERKRLEMNTRRFQEGFSPARCKERYTSSQNDLDDRASSYSRRSSRLSVLNNPYNAPESYRKQQRNIRPLSSRRKRRPSTASSAADGSALSIRPTSAQPRRSSSSSSLSLNSKLATQAAEKRMRQRNYPGTASLRTTVDKIHMPTHTTTTEEDIEYLSKLISQRKSDMKKGKLSSAFMDADLAEDRKVKQINRESSTALKMAQQIPVPVLTTLFDTIKREEDGEPPSPHRRFSKNAHESPTRRSKRPSTGMGGYGSSRFDRLLHEARGTCMSQLQSDFNARKVAVRKELERDGVVVFGKATNYEHFFKAKLIDILYSESKKAIVLKIKTKGLVHDCILDGMEVQPNMMTDAKAIIWNLVEQRRQKFSIESPREELSTPRHDLIYFPVRSNTEGQLCIDVFLQLQWLQCVLLHYGIARIAKNYSEKLGIERLIEHQVAAKQKHVGLWQHNLHKRHSAPGDAEKNSAAVASSTSRSRSSSIGRRHSNATRRPIRRFSIPEIPILDGE